MAINGNKPRLQGHEKFALREGWLNKGLEILPQYPDAFTRKDATDLFGIGSNMVKSLRYWMKAFGLTNDNGTELSDVGKIIAKYDPYIEKMFSLWVMHSYIAKNLKDATTWYMYFNRCDADDLSKTEIEIILNREITSYAADQKFSEKSLGNDIDVLLNMYSKRKSNEDPEDKSVSPFALLALIKNANGKYGKHHPDRKHLSEWIVLYELVQSMQDTGMISIETAVNGENGLAKIYNLTNVMANDYFDRLDAADAIRVNRTAGLDMIYATNQLSPIEIIENYYLNN